MEFRILGPLEVRNEHGEIALGGPEPRAILPMLFLDANNPVSQDRLVKALWGADAPADRANPVQVHVSRLRKALGRTAMLESTGNHAYRLRVEPDQLDAICFTQLVDDARRAGELGRYDRAGELARERSHCGEARRLPTLNSSRSPRCKQPEIRSITSTNNGSSPSRRALRPTSPCPRLCTLWPIR